jgi:serine/threonine protein kinase/WD40 repeat protein/outer membrane biosynthesis protein TonB
MQPHFNSPDHKPVANAGGKSAQAAAGRTATTPDATIAPPSISGISPESVDADRTIAATAPGHSDPENVELTSPTMSALTGTDVPLRGGQPCEPKVGGPDGGAEQPNAEPVAADAEATIVVRPGDLPPDSPGDHFDPQATMKAPAGVFGVPGSPCETALVTPSMVGGDNAAVVSLQGSAGPPNGQRIRRHRFDSEHQLPAGGAMPRLSPAVSALVDNQVDEYEMLKVIGKGGMGLVRRARQKSLYRDLAVKTLKSVGEDQDIQQMQDMFVTEAVITASLVHPNIIPVHDLGLDAQGRLFYSMKEIKGKPWKELIERTDSQKRKAELERNLDILLKVCDAIAYAHMQGVIHRDLKPENVSVGQYGEVIVLDWGLAVPMPGFTQQEPGGPTRPVPLLVMPGPAGSLPWMAPEQALSELDEICPQTDIYLLGAMLFEIIEGIQPHLLREFEGLTGNSLRNALTFAVIENRIEEDVENPGELMQIARRAMATDPADRYQSVEEFQRAIQQYRITGRAEELLLKVQESGEKDRYELYQQSVALFSRALQDWPDNDRAKKGDRAARLAFAELALKRGDFDLGIEICGSHEDRALVAIRSRLSRQRTQRKIIRATWLLLGAAAAALLVVAVRAKLEVTKNYEDLKQRNGDVKKLNGDVKKLSDEIEEKKTAAVAAENEAKTANQKAIAEKENAIKFQSEAAKEKQKAEEEKQKAEEAKKQAEDEKQKAEKAKKQAEDEKQRAEEAKKQAEDEKQRAEEAKKQADKAKEAEQRQVYQTVIQRLDTAESLEDWQEFIEIAREALSQLKDNPTVRRQQLEAIETRLKTAEMKAAGPDENGSVSLPATGIVPSVRSRMKLIPGGGGVLRLEGDKTAAVRGVRVLLAKADVVTGSALGQLAELPATFRNADLNSIGASATEDAQRVWLWAGKQLFVWQKIASGGYQLVGDQQLPAPILDVDSDRVGRLFAVCGDNACTTAIYDVIDGELRSLLPADTKLFAETRAEYPCSAWGVTADGGWILHYSRYGTDRHLRAFPVDWSDPAQPRLPADAGLVPLRKLSELQSTEGAPKDIAGVHDLQISDDGSVLLLSVDLRSKDRWFVLLPALPQQRKETFPFGLQAGWFRSGETRAPVDVRLSADGRLLIAYHARARKNIEVWKAAADGRISAFSLPGEVSKGRKNRHAAGGSLVPGLTEQPLDVLPLDVQTGRFLSVSSRGMTRWNLSTYGEWIEVLRGLLSEFPRPSQAAVRRDRVDVGSYIPAVLGVPADEADEVVAATVPLDTAELSVDGQRLILGGLDRAAHVISSNDLQPVLDLSGRPDPLRVGGGRGLFLEGHTSNISAARFLSAESGLLLTSENLGVISVWDARPDSDGLGREVSRLVTGYGSGVFSVSRDGSLIVADGAELRGEDLIYQALIWRADGLGTAVAPQPVQRLLASDAATEKLFAQKQMKPVFQITATAVSVDNRLVAIGGRQGELTVWELETGKIVSLQRAHGGDQVSGLWFLSATEFVSSGYDGRLLRWQLTPENQLSFRELYRGQQLISLSVSPDGRWYVISDIVARQGAASVAVPGSARRRVPTVLKMLAVSAADGTRKLLPELDIPLENPEQALQTGSSWSADSRQLLLTLPDRLVLYGSDDWKPLRQLAISGQAGGATGPGRAILAPSDADGQRMASISGRRAELWDLTGGSRICEFRSHHSERVTASFSADRRLVLTASEALRIFDADEVSPTRGKTLYRILPEQSHQSPLDDARFIPLPGDYRFLTVEKLGLVKLWNCSPAGIPDAQPVWRSDDEVSAPATADHNLVRWSDNGGWFAAVRAGRVTCWNLAGNLPVPVDLPIPDGVEVQWNTLTFSADSGRLAAGGKGRESAEAEEQGLVLIWRLVAGKPATLIGKLSGAGYVAVSDSEDSGSQGQILRGGATALAFSGAKFFVGDGTGGVTRWALGDVPENSDAVEPAAFEQNLKRDSEGHLSRIVGIFGVDLDGAERMISVDASGRLIRWR